MTDQSLALISTCLVEKYIQIATPSQEPMKDAQRAKNVKEKMHMSVKTAIKEKNLELRVVVTKPVIPDLNMYLIVLSTEILSQNRSRTRSNLTYLKIKKILT